MFLKYKDNQWIFILFLEILINYGIIRRFIKFIIYTIFDIFDTITVI